MTRPFQLEDLDRVHIRTRSIPSMDRYDITLCNLPNMRVFTCVRLEAKVDCPQCRQIAEGLRAETEAFR